MNISYEIYGTFIRILTEFFHVVFPALMESWSGFVVAVVGGILVPALGIYWARGGFGERSMEVLKSGIIFCVVMGITMENSGMYMDWIVDPLFGSFQEIAAFFVSQISEGDVSGIAGLFRELDGMIGDMIGVVKNMQPVGWKVWNYIIGTIAIVLLCGAYGCVYFAFFTVIIITVFSLHIYFLVGGIFLYFAALKSTRHLFWAWFKAIMNQGLVMIFAAIVMALCLFGVQEALEVFVATADISKGVFRLEYAMVIAWCMISFITLLKVPDLAASLSGGMAGATYAIMRTMGLMGGGAAGLVGFAGSKAGRGIGKVGGTAYRSFWDTPRPYSKMMGKDVSPNM